jgi:hypothetical protein
MRLQAIDLDELHWLHSEFAAILRGCGLKGHDLDQAIADCTTAACAVIEKSRATENTRRERIRIVASGGD